jgi:hypothetical protein
VNSSSWSQWKLKTNSSTIGINQALIVTNVANPRLLDFDQSGTFAPKNHRKGAPLLTPFSVCQPATDYRTCNFVPGSTRIIIAILDCKITVAIRSLANALGPIPRVVFAELGLRTY